MVSFDLVEALPDSDGAIAFHCLDNPLVPLSEDKERLVPGTQEALDHAYHIRQVANRLGTEALTTEVRLILQVMTDGAIGQDTAPALRNLMRSDPENPRYLDSPTADFERAMDQAKRKGLLTEEEVALADSALEAGYLGECAIYDYRGFNSYWAKDGLVPYLQEAPLLAANSTIRTHAQRIGATHIGFRLSLDWVTSESGLTTPQRLGKDRMVLGILDHRGQFEHMAYVRKK